MVMTMVKLMKHLIKLNITKKIATFRNYFAKPISAIAMIIVLGFLAFSFYSLTVGPDDFGIDKDTTGLFLTAITLVISLFFVFAMIIPNRRSLFFEEDSYYLFIGPYTNRQLLTYASIDFLVQSISASLIVTGLICITSFAAAELTIGFILLVFFLITVIVYLVSMVMQLIYLRDLIHNFKGNKKRYIVLAVLILSIVAVIAMSFIKHSGDVNDSLEGFYKGVEFYFIPLFGWLKLALDSFYSNSLLMLLLPMIGMVVLSLFLTYAFVNTKGYFFEQAMIDAVDFTAYYKNAKAGKVPERTKKLGKANVKFGKYSNAIFSKNLLILKKTKKILKFNDIMGIILVQFLSFSLGGEPLVYIGSIAVYLMANVEASSLKEELKSNYTYLIPDKPIKKLINSLFIPILKSAIFVLVCIIIPLVTQNINLKEFLILLGITLSMVAVFYAAQILSLRIMKSRDNMLVQQFLLLGLSIAFLLPSVCIAAIFFAFTSDLLKLITVIVPIVVVINLVLSCVVFYLCSPMMSYNALNQD